ncbi:MAG TPA: HutD family protein [Rhodanobacteraceae bacterium]|nr:HutD family protein [Rhodanobacteraceae bacterium]
MPALRVVQHHEQRDEPWANGTGRTTVILREPDSADWTVRISVANVETEGPFSELPDTRRTLVPLDAPMTLRFPDGSERHAARFGVLRFEGSPAPCGVLPEGPTRDFNLMLRGKARGEVSARTLVDSMLLPTGRGVRWLVYVVAGRVTLRTDTAPGPTLGPGDAVLVPADRTANRTVLAGTGEIVLVKLYA